MKLLLLGDFYFDYDYIPEDYIHICSWIKENGYQVVLNLESSLSSEGKAIKKRGPNLCCSATAKKALLEINTLAVTLANNHTMDFGEEGLLKTLEQLDRTGIKHLGAGNNLLDAEKTLVIEDSSTKQNLVLLNFGWDVEETVYATDNTAGCAPLDRSRILKRIASIKEKDNTSKIILLMHWGFEYNTLPMPADIKFAHQCIDAGADLIVGHHPHVIQPMEEYRGKCIYYSLGNYYFGSRRKLFNKIFPNEDEKYYSSIGAGVVIDTERWLTDQIKVQYDFKDKLSSVCNWKDFPTINENDYKDKLYVKKTKIHAMNHNPILTGDAMADSIKINFLNLEYKIYSYIKTLRKVFNRQR